MYPAERHAAILRAAREDPQHRVAVAALSAALSVTAETIRRDLATLERQGLLRRRWGGAELAGPRAPFELSLDDRRLEERAERRAIARRVADELPADGVVILDSGSMTLDVAAEFPADRPLIVVTNSLPAAALLARHPRLTVLALPGPVRSVTQATVGEWTSNRIRDLHADLAVLGANGVSAEHGVTTTLPDEAEVKRAMLHTARRRILAVTAPKIGTASFCRVAGVDEFDTIITDDRVERGLADAIRSAGTDVVAVSPEPLRERNSRP